MIVCVGTTPTMQRTMTFEQVRLDDVNRTANVQEYASGKSINVARVLTTLGHKVLATGFLGGERASAFRADLVQAGITHDFVNVKAPTRLCTTVIDRAAGTATELVEESHPVTEADYDSLIEKVMRHVAGAKMLILSGSLPPDAKPDFYAYCAALAGRNVRVILDAVGEPLLQALKYKPFVIKPNESELARTLDAEVDSEDSLRGAMRELVSRGASWVVVTRGKRGALATNGKRFWQIISPEVKALNPIGSGDSFAAGLAAGILAGDDVPKSCRLAAACGAANAITPLAGHVRVEDVEALAEQVVLK